MILAISTKDEVCHMVLLDAEGGKIASIDWLAKRELAKGLLSHIEDFLEHNRCSFEQLSGLIIFKGPGSFTGLRIGVTVMNTLAYSLHIPIVGAKDEAWIEEGVRRLSRQENDQIVVPFYGRDPRITQARK